jgi:eukaryotic-like serine/threonine-protein kinase
MAGETFVVEGFPVESGEPVGTVVSQDPKLGETAGEGATISVRVSGRQIETLPDVEGKTIEEARQSIRSRPFSLEVKTVESSSREIGRVLGQNPKGGDGVTAEAGTHVTVTVGGGPSAAMVPDLRDPHPKETTPMLGDQTGTPNDRGSEGRNVEQRPSAGTEVEPEDPVVNTEAPASDLATVSGVMGRNDQEGFESDDYASWLGESRQYESGQYGTQ